MIGSELDISRCFLLLALCAQALAQAPVCAQACRRGAARVGRVGGLRARRRELRGTT